MTMVHKLRGQRNLAKSCKHADRGGAGGNVSCGRLQAEDPPVHYHHAGILPPGAIGSQQLQRGGPLPGYFQPVEIKAPQGASISTAGLAEFDELASRRRCWPAC